MNKKIAVSLLALVFAACGSKSNTNPYANVAQVAKDPALQSKVFVSSCAKTPGAGIVTGLLSGGSAALKSTLSEYQFLGANVTRTSAYFEYADCTGKPAIELIESGSFKINKGIKTEDGGTGVDVAYNNIEAKVNDDAGVAAANAVKLCGQSNWDQNVGKQRVVTANSKDLTCANEQVPRAENSLYKVEGNTLKLAGSGAGNNKRPTTLDSADKFVVKDK